MADLLEHRHYLQDHRRFAAYDRALAEVARGQIVLDRHYAYIGHQHRPDGTTIVDISEPRKPKILSEVKTTHP